MSNFEKKERFGNTYKLNKQLEKILERIKKRKERKISGSGSFLSNIRGVVLLMTMRSLKC